MTKRDGNIIEDIALALLNLMPFYAVRSGVVLNYVYMSLKFDLQELHLQTLTYRCVAPGLSEITYVPEIMHLGLFT
jgi:hypothetical protein